LLESELCAIDLACSGPPELVLELLRAGSSLLLCCGKLRDTSFSSSKLGTSHRH